MGIDIILLHMVPKNIFLVRHGQSEGNENPDLYITKPAYALNLTRKGEVQARQAGRELFNIIGYDSHGVYCSPLFRTKQTLHNINEWLPDRNRFFTKYDPLIREQECGNFEDIKNHDRHKFLDQSYEYGAFYYHFRDGESGAAVHDRIRTFMLYMERDWNASNQTPDHIIIVGHGFTNRVIIQALTNMDPVDFAKIDNPKNGEVIQLTWDTKRGDHLDWKPAYPLRMNHQQPYEYNPTPNELNVETDR